MRTVIVVLVALFVAGVLSVPDSRAFTTSAVVIQKDGSSDVISWFYDAYRQSERIVYHRDGGLETISLRFYDQGIEYFIVESKSGDQCHVLPIAEKMAPASTRASIFTQNEAVVRWDKVVNGPVNPSAFDIPSSCQVSEARVGDGIFCDSCLDVGQQVIALGCNATSDELAKICGNMFMVVCKTILEEACSGVCNLEDCTKDACCAIDLCSGDTCNGTSSSGTTASSVQIPQESGTGAAHEGAQDKFGDGMFCDTCLSVGQAVIGLGCNATSSAIAQLCGNLFAGVCKEILDSLCSGGCSVADCAADACCLFSLCTGSTCGSSSSSSSSQAHPALTPY